MSIEMIYIKVQNWCGCNVRFVKYCGTWYAVLKDICDALNLHTYNISYVINANDLRRIPVPSSKREAIAQPMLVVNERGLYQVLLFKDRRPEARQFTDWVCGLLEHMRTAVGLQPYEALRMTEPKIRYDIDEQLDDILAYNKE
jgi:prophage antirepressor-like protein